MAQFQKWLQKVIQACKAPRKELKIAVDAKTLRNSGDDQEGTPALRVLSVLVQGLGLILATIEMPPGINELGVIKLLLGIVGEIVGLEGKVITMDAIFTQKEIADSIVKKRHYLMWVKGNQPELLETLKLWFEEVH